MRRTITCLLLLAGAAHADNGSARANGGVTVSSHPRPGRARVHGAVHARVHGSVHVPMPVPVVVVPPPPPSVVVVGPPPPSPVVVTEQVVVEAGPQVVVEAAPPSDTYVATTWSGGGGPGRGVDPLATSHWEASVAMLVATDFGADEPSIGASIGRQLGALRVSLDYMRYERDLDLPTGCRVPASRIGLTARYRVSMDLDGAGLGLYVEAGAGREARTHELRMTEAVPTALVGAGLEFLMGEDRSAGFDVGIRGIVDGEDRLAGLVQVGVLLGSR